MLSFARQLSIGLAGTFNGRSRLHGALPQSTTPTLRGPPAARLQQLRYNTGIVDREPGLQAGKLAWGTALRQQCRRGLIDGMEKHLGARVWALPAATKGVLQLTIDNY